jgi:DNA-binding helix-hairpin-helix protein with protein kinase domain
MADTSQQRRLLTDHCGRVWTPSKRVAEGGEGAVYTLVEDGSVLAKLFTKPPSAQTVAKLAWMVKVGTPALKEFTAWPLATLHTQASPSPVGFLMPSFTGFQAIHHLYSPAQRERYFPRADWVFLAQVARNCAAAVDEVHEHGCVIGDVNQSNVLVSANALVALIDCDSFQVGADTATYLCEVGVELYTPPELQGRSFRGVIRTPNHDRFGLAVLLFQLLFMGRHPFIGRFSGPGDPLPVHRLIREFRFAFRASSRPPHTDRPPSSLSLNDISPGLANLFDRAFLPGSDRPNARPSPGEWIQALRSLIQDLAVCTEDAGHRYVRSLARGCCWCALIRSGGPNYFDSVIADVRFELDRESLRHLVGEISRPYVPLPEFDRRAYQATAREPVAALPEQLATRLLAIRVLPPLAPPSGVRPSPFRPSPPPVALEPPTRPIRPRAEDEPAHQLRPRPQREPRLEFAEYVADLPPAPPTYPPGPTDYVPSPPAPEPYTSPGPGVPARPQVVLPTIPRELNELSRLAIGWCAVAVAGVALACAVPGAVRAGGLVTSAVFGLQAAFLWLAWRHGMNRLRATATREHSAAVLDWERKIAALRAREEVSRRRHEAKHRLRLSQWRKAERKRREAIDAARRAWEHDVRQAQESHADRVSQWQESERQRRGEYANLKRAWEKETRRAEEDFQQRLRMWEAEVAEQRAKIAARQEELDQAFATALSAWQADEWARDQANRAKRDAWEENNRQEHERYVAELKEWEERDRARRAQVDARQVLIDAYRKELSAERGLRHQRLIAARNLLEAVETEWREVVARFMVAGANATREAEDARRECEGLVTAYSEELRELGRRGEGPAREQFLRAHFLVDQVIVGIGPVRKQILLADGIETAFDIDVRRVLAIKGFGPKVAQALLAWRLRLEQSFHYDPTQALPEATRRPINRRYRQLQKQVFDRLRGLASGLRALREDCHGLINRLQNRVPGLATGLAEARVDLEALPDDH